MKHVKYKEFNNWAKDHIFDENKFDNDGNIIMENELSYKTTGIISKIFHDWWDTFYAKYKYTIDLKRPNYVLLVVLNLKKLKLKIFYKNV